MAVRQVVPRRDFRTNAARGCTIGCDSGTLQGLPFVTPGSGTDEPSLMPARLFAARDESRRAFLVGIVAVVAMTAFITWPQARRMRTTFASHVDPYFSAWRIMWFAHALRTDPWHVFDGNIFHPSTGTLAFSDATLLESVVAAPF